MTKQTITTEEQITTGEKIGIIITALESQIIDEGIQGLNEPRFKSTWDEIDQSILKNKILALINQL